MKSITEWVDIFRQGTTHLRNMAENLDCPWNPDQDGARKLHNNYAKNLITCYVSKFSDLSDAILHSIEKENYLVYALAGRALIEITATLRYYVLHKYKPLLDKGSLSIEEMQSLIEIDDQHLRGSRFDWNSFFSKKYFKLKENAVKHLAMKKAKQKYIVDGIIHEQVNVVTCIEKWADETPEVLITYNLFCDLVHPNIGSSFLIASTSDSGLYFSRFKGSLVGKSIFEQSFPILISVTHKPFGDFLLLLMGTIWQEEEI